MSRFRREDKKHVQAINTASLPDIVFMLLFFFMVTTTMKEVTLRVRVNSPYATEIQKLENKSLVSYIYIGQPIQKSTFGTLPRIQLNDAFAEPSQIREFISAQRQKTPEDERPKMTVSLKVDENVKMGIVTDVKQELRKASALKINYSTKLGNPITMNR